MTVSDDVVRWAGVTSREALLGRLEEIEKEKWEQYAAMAEAKARLVRGEQVVESGSGTQVEMGPVHMQPTRYFGSVALRLGARTPSLVDEVVFLA